MGGRMGVLLGLGLLVAGEGVAGSLPPPTPAHASPVGRTVRLRLPEPLPVSGRAVSAPVDPTDPEALAALIGRPADGAHVARVGEHWMADIPVLVDGVPVFRGDTLVRGVGPRAGLVIERPIGAPTGAFELSAGAAVEAVRDATGSVDARSAVRRVIAPGDPPRRAFEVSLESSTASYKALVDGQTAEVIALWSEHAWLSGTVTAAHHARGVDGAPLVVSPLPGARVIGDAGEVFADGTGAWTLDTALPVTVTLAGEYATVIDRQGTDLLWPSDTEAVHLEGPEADLSEIDAYVHAHEVREWGLAVWPDNSFVADPIELHVEQALAGCNAYFLGRALHFYRPVPTCWSPAQHADVIYHEWGHGLHFHGRAVGTFDLALSEGVSDVVAWRMTGDPVIARGLFKDGTGFRDLTEVKRYPDDYTIDDAHYSGWIVGGAFFDFGWIAAAELGQAQALTALDRLFVPFLAAGPEVATAYLEALAADDDDGDLSTGTPHDCAITMAFGRHGFGPLAGGWTVTADHAPPAVEADAPFELVAALAAVPDPCLDRAVGPATLVWTVDGEARPDLVAEPDGASVVAGLDGLPGGSVVAYRFEGALYDGTPWASPETGTWTLEIASAPVEDTGPAAPRDDGEAEPGGCGCDQGGLGGALALPALFLVALRRRA